MIFILAFSGSVGISLTYSAGILIGIQISSCFPFPHGVSCYKSNIHLKTSKIPHGYHDSLAVWLVQTLSLIDTRGCVQWWNCMLCTWGYSIQCYGPTTVATIRGRESSTLFIQQGESYIKRYRPETALDPNGLPCNSGSSNIICYSPLSVCDRSLKKKSLSVRSVYWGPIPKWKSCNENCNENCNEIQFWFYDMCKLQDFSNCPL